MKRREVVIAGLATLLAAGIFIAVPALRRVASRFVWGSDDQSLTPAAVPDPDHRPPDGIIPGSNGDRIVVDRAGGRVSRVGAGEGPRWATPLSGSLDGVRPPHVAADAERAYVSHADGVTALDARTGRVLWASPGPADRLLVSGDLLLATDCLAGEAVARRGRWFVARRTATGAEAFRVALPATGFDPQPIAEAAGVFVVQSDEDPGGLGVAILVDRTGGANHRFDRQVVAITALGPDRLVLTSRDIVRLTADGRESWRSRSGAASGSPGADWYSCPAVTFALLVLRDCGHRGAGHSPRPDPRPEGVGGQVSGTGRDTFPVQSGCGGRGRRRPRGGHQPRRLRDIRGGARRGIREVGRPPRIRRP